MRRTHVSTLVQTRYRRPRAPSATTTATVLVVEELPFTADAVAAQLRGRRPTKVLWCRGPDGRVPCSLAPRTDCPLAECVDVVVDVRTAQGEELTSGEAGVACAGAVGIPVIAAVPEGPDVRRVPWALATCALDDVADFCLHVHDHPDQWRRQRLEDLVQRVLRMRDEEGGRVTADLRPWLTCLTILIRTERSLSASACEAVDAALRAVEPPIAPTGVRLALSFMSEA